MVEIKTYRMVPKPEPVRILQAMLYSLEVSQDAFIEPATKKVRFVGRGCVVWLSWLEDGGEGHTPR